MNKEILTEIILSNQEFILDNPQVIYPRINVELPEKVRKVVVLFGVRRSGKTFILYEFFKKHPESCLYIDFEDDRLKDFKVEDFELLREVFFEIKPECFDREVFFLFDEIQIIKGWERFCRRITEKENIKVIVSGSSSEIKPKEISTVMRGRSWAIEVFPFSFKEFCLIRNVTVKKLFGRREKFKIIQLLKEFLRWGGFPEVALSESMYDKKKISGEYLDAMFFKDLIENYKMTNISLFDTLKDFLFSNYAAKFSLNSFYNQYRGKFSFSKDLLYRYYNNFIDSTLVNEVRIFSESSYQRMRNPAKIYIVDNSLCSKYSLDNQGRFYENMVFGELLRKNNKIHYFHNSGECDFIVKGGEEEYQAIQVCYRLDENNREREIRGLIGACRFLGIDNGEIVVFDQREEEFKVEGIVVKVRNFQFFLE